MLNVPRPRLYAAWASGPLTVALGVAAHVISGESVPGPSVLLALAALLSMAASMLAGLRIRTWMLLIASGVVQQVLHLAFAAFPVNGGGTSRGHPHDAPILPQPQAVPASGGHHAIELMLDTHVAAALLAVVILTQSAPLVSKLFSPREPSPGIPGHE